MFCSEGLRSSLNVLAAPNLHPIVLEHAIQLGTVHSTEIAVPGTLAKIHRKIHERLDDVLTKLKRTLPSVFTIASPLALPDVRHSDISRGNAGRVISSARPVKIEPVDISYQSLKIALLKLQHFFSKLPVSDLPFDSLPMLPFPPEYIAVGTGTPLPVRVETWSCMPVDPGPLGIFLNFQFRTCFTSIFHSLFFVTCFFSSSP